MKRYGKIWFWGYAVLMLWLLFGQRIGGTSMTWESWLETSVNLIPGRTVVNLFRGAWNQWIYQGETALLRFALINNLGNIVMFIPLGCGLPMLWLRQRHRGCFLLTVLLIILAVETVQLVTMLGSWDVDDLLLNLLGAAIGFAIWKKCTPA